jgi:hypothetical protein
MQISDEEAIEVQNVAPALRGNWLLGGDRIDMHLDFRFVAVHILIIHKVMLRSVASMQTLI